MEEFYVYIYLDPRKPGHYKYGEFEFDYEPFYVGKGKNNRFLDHLDENFKNTANKFKFYIINSIKKQGLTPVIIKVKDNLTDISACEIEKELIKIIGRKKFESGPLTNISDGGNGGYNIAAVNSNKLKRSGKTWEEIYGIEMANKLKDKLKKRLKNTDDKFLTHMKGQLAWNSGKTGYKIKGRDEESKERSRVAMKNSSKHKEVMASKEVRDKISSKNRELTTEYWKDENYRNLVLQKRKDYWLKNPKIKKSDLIQYLNDFKTKKQLCDHFNVSYPTLDKYIKIYNLT